MLNTHELLLLELLLPRRHLDAMLTRPRSRGMQISAGSSIHGLDDAVHGVGGAHGSPSRHGMLVPVRPPGFGQRCSAATGAANAPFRASIDCTLGFNAALVLQGAYGGAGTRWERLVVHCWSRL